MGELASRLRDERGQVAPIAVGLLLIILSVAGLAIDGGLAFNARLHFGHLADGAARAGAAAIDEDPVYGASRLRLDWREAEARARDYLAEVACRCQADVGATSTSVRVSVRGSQETVFLRVAGIDSVPIGATAEAEPVDPQPEG